MSSQNEGEQLGKRDYAILFEDFPHSNPRMVQMLREERYRDLLSVCVMNVGWEEIHRARLYGIRKYDADNWKLSIGTKDHDNFLAANKRSIYRHLAAEQSGEAIDEESGLNHLAMVALRCMIAIEYQEQQGTVEVASDHKVTPLGGSTPPTLTYLRRRDEMPEWLVKLIEERCRPEHTDAEGVASMFSWVCSPEGSEFWRQVDNWTYGDGDLPENPQKQPRYPWDEAPELAQWAAIDKDGEGYWYESKPELLSCAWKSRAAKWYFIHDNMLHQGENWETTLEQRPQ